MVFGIGPAGTGKTYLAVAMAVAGLLNKRFNRIVLARPAVEAGERLGFLPGSLQEKVDPYLRPLYDALYDMLDVEKVDRYLERGTIEIAPIAFMRGRTLNEAFVILDEAQKHTSEQMKMFLTRMGFNSKAVITGDITQIDLPAGKTSGLVEPERWCRTSKALNSCISRRKMLCGIRWFSESFERTMPIRPRRPARSRLQELRPQHPRDRCSSQVMANSSS
jgi:phosphate starvation-inducible PhoH-like protein